MLMASLRDPYAGVGVSAVGMLAASQLAQLNHLMMQQQQQHPEALPPQARSPPLAPQRPQIPGMSMSMASMGPGSPGTPPECQSPPISRTYTYKKVTKPLLERKRRARINRCLDELKELMVGALEAEGENVSKLEKADILELTVRHLQRITKPRDAAEDASRFQAGFSQCASEACHFLLGLPGLDAGVGRRLVAHLSQVVTGLGAGGGGGGDSSGGGLRPTAYSPPASPDLLMARQAAASAALPGQGSSTHPAGHASPEVSSSTERVVRHKRSRSEEEDSEDDLYPDSDAPVNYTSEALSALSRRHKRPRSSSHGSHPVSSSAPSASPSHSGSQSGSDDEDKGPMWRPW